MRTILLVIALILPVTARAQGDSADAKTRAELERARDIVWRAWFAGDTVTLDRVIAGALAAGGNIEGWADRRTAIAGSRDFAASGSKLLDLRFDRTAIELHGKVAVMTARFTYTTADRAGRRETANGYAVEIFVHENGAWTHPFWHLARQAPDSPMIH